MEYPVYASNEFVSASILNNGFAAVSGSINAAMQAAMATPGLVHPEQVALTYNGNLTVTVGLPAPFGVLFSNGVMARAHGTVTGSDTTNYTADLSSLVPVSGSVTAYILASQSQINQDSYTVVGAPPGHPDYNPNFTPYVSYARAQDTLSLAGSTTAANNTTTFEIARTTLTAGQTVVSTASVANQVISSSWIVRPEAAQTTSAALTASDLNYMLTCAVSGVTTTLPLASQAPGRIASFTNTGTSNWTVAASGSDQIRGTWGLNVSGVASSVTLNSYGAMALWSNGAAWSVVSAPAAFTVPVSGRAYSTPGTYTFIVPENVYRIAAKTWGAGGGGGGALNDTCAATGAGAGAFAEGIYSVTPGQSITVTVGAGGAGGAAGSDGSAGGTSSFGSFCSATGGAGGKGSTSGIIVGVLIPGGTATGGTKYNLSGDIGKWGYQAPTSSSLAAGAGGGAPFGGSVIGSPVLSVGANGLFPGGGASGASTYAAGGTGANGCVELNW